MELQSWRVLHTRLLIAVFVLVILQFALSKAQGQGLFGRVTLSAVLLPALFWLAADLGFLIYVCYRARKAMRWWLQTIGIIAGLSLGTWISLTILKTFVEL